MGVPLWAWVAAGWAALEALSLAALRHVHRRTGVYYLPRGRPRLSRQAVATLERLVAEEGRGAVMEHSATLGWTVRPGVTSSAGRVHTNSRGLRGTREPAAAPPPGVTRVLTFGDCLTFGGGVSDDATFQTHMETRNPRLEVLNFGVDGYGPVQMLLRYRESAGWCRSHDVAVLCLASSNVFKPLNAFRPFMAYDHGLPFGLPRAFLRGRGLEIAPNPLGSLDDYRRLLANPAHELERIGELDDYYRSKFTWSPADVLPSVRAARTVFAEVRKLLAVLTPRGTYRGSSAAVTTTVSVLDAFAAEALARGARPVIVLFPTPRDVRVFVSRGVNTSAQIVAAVRGRGLECVDMLEDLGTAAREIGFGRVFTGRYYSALGNDVVARRLIAALRATRSRSDIIDGAAAHSRAGTLQAVPRP